MISRRRRWPIHRCLPLLIPLIPLVASAGGVGISTPPEPGSTEGAQQITNITFNPYKVPTVRSRLANRDLEFLWSNNYRALFERPLDSLYAASTESDLDRFGKTIADTKYTNPFLFEYTDIQLIYDYLNRRTYAFRDSVYDFNPDHLIGYKVNQPTYPDDDRKHTDTYIYVPTFSNDPGFPDYGGDVWPNYGRTPSDFLDSVNEDLSTGKTGDAVLHDNSLMIPGPRPSQVGDLNEATRWTGADVQASWGFNHEFQHAIDKADPPTPLNEIFSSAAEALAGEKADRPQFDVPYTHNLLRWDFFGGLHNYQAWRSFSAYVTLNFRGVDPSATGRNDDLLWRWAMGPTRTLTALAARLSPQECAECASKPYFNGLSPTDRFHLLLHNWRVANFVNSTALANGQYGFAQPPQAALGFDPFRDIGAWQNVDPTPAANDSFVVPHETTVTLAQIGKDLSLAGPPGGSKVHTVALEHFGADYWVVKSDAALASANRDLVIHIIPEGNVAGIRLTASAVAYVNQPQPGDSLWKHPEWAALALTPLSTDTFAPAGGPLEFLVPSFGQTYKAVLVVVTSSQTTDTWAEGYVLPYRLNLGLRTGTYLSPNPLAVQTENTYDDFATWSPRGDTLAYTRASGGLAQIYLKRLDGTPATPLVPQPHAQVRPDWSPRGDWIAFEQDATISNTDIYAYNLGTSELRQLTSAPNYEFEPIFSPNGQRIAYLQQFSGTQSGHRISRVDLAGGNDAVLGIRYYDNPYGPPLHLLRWSPDGQWVYFLVGDSLYAVGADGPNYGLVLPRRQLPNGTQAIDLPLGNQGIANEVRTDVSHVAVYDTLQNENQFIFYRPGMSFTNPRWSFDGTRIAYTSDQLAPGASDIFVAQVGYNHAPSFANVADMQVYLSAPLSLQLLATDPDGEPVTFAGGCLPPGATLSPSGLFEWPDPFPYSGNPVYVTFRALDPSGGVDNRVVQFDIITGAAAGAAAPW